MDKYNNPILTIDEGRKALLYGNDIEGVMFDDIEEIERFCNGSRKVLGEKATINAPYEGTDSLEEYHSKLAKQWNIPEEFKQIDVREYLLDKCLTDEEIARVELEYAMFEERGLIPLLQFLMFIVKYMRDKNIVWGVGRGSSVASYCLYLMGVHKVNSLKYELPITEFLK